MLEKSRESLNSHLTRKIAKSDTIVAGPSKSLRIAPRALRIDYRVSPIIAEKLMDKVRLDDIMDAHGRRCPWGTTQTEEMTK